MSTNELKRTRKHVASMAYAIGLTRGVVLTCRCGEWKRTGKHERPLREEHRAHRVEMGEWVKPRKEGPDWADVREAARNAGYRLRRRGPVDTPSPRTKVVHWDLEPISRNPDGDPGGGFNLVHWWQFRDGEEDAGITVEIDLDDYNGTEAHVWDATPARAMHGLHLVGLGRDSDER